MKTSKYRAGIPKSGRTLIPKGEVVVWVGRQFLTCEDARVTCWPCIPQDDDECRQCQLPKASSK